MYMYQELPMHHSTIGSPSTEMTFEHEAFVVNLERRGVWGSLPQGWDPTCSTCAKKKEHHHVYWENHWENPWKIMENHGKSTISIYFNGH